MLAHTKRVKPGLVLWSMVLGLFALVYGFLSVALLLMQWWVWPRLDDYRPWVETQLSKTLQQTVRIQNLQGRWQGAYPELQIQGLSVVQADGKPALQVPRASIGVSLWSIFRLSPKLSWVHVQNAELWAERSTNGAVRVAGVPLALQEQQPSFALNWVLRQQAWQLHFAKVHWQDAQNPWPATHWDGHWSNVQLVLRNTFFNHKAALQWELPQLSSAPMQLRTQFVSPWVGSSQGDWRQWRGQVFVRATAHPALALNLPKPAVLATWLPMLKNLQGLELQGPSGQLWFNFSAGLVQRLYADVRLQHARFGFAAQQSLVLSNLATQVLVEGKPSLAQPMVVDVQNIQAQVQPLGGQETNARPWSFGPSALRLSRILQSTSTQYSLDANNLNLGHLHRLGLVIAPMLSQTSALQYVYQHQFAGLVPHASLRFQTSSQPWQVDSFDIDAAVQGLHWIYQNPESNVTPTGIHGLSGGFKGNQVAGQWQLQSQAVKLWLPKVFGPEALQWDTLQGHGQWQNALASKEPLHLHVDTLQAKNADITATFEGGYRFANQAPGVVDIRGTIERAAIAAIPRYMPLSVSENVRTWLAQALQDGEVRKGQLVLKGNLADFPFTRAAGLGLFRIEAPFERGQLAFSPDWPALTNIQGRAVFQGRDLRIEASQAKTLNVPLRQVSVVLEGMGQKDPVLAIVGESQGPLQSMLDYTTQSPVGMWLGQVLQTAQAQGAALLALKLNLPLKNLKSSTLDGQLHLQNNQLRLVPGMPWVSNLEGQVQFAERKLQLHNIRGAALGGPLVVEGGTDVNQHFEFKARGQARALGLAQYLSPRLLPYLQGQTAYAVRLVTGQERLDIVIDSTLQGLGLSLPAPFAKSADQDWPLKLQFASSGGVDRWALDVAAPSGSAEHSSALPWVSQLRASLPRRNGQPSLESLQWVVGEPLPTPTMGIALEGRVPSLDADAWRRVYQSLGQNSGVAVQTTPESDGLLEPWFKSSAGIGSNFRARLRADRVVFQGKSFEGLSLVARTVEKRWQFDVNAQGVEGYWTWLTDIQRPEGAVLARFKRLAIPKSLDAPVRGAVEDPVSGIPALDIQVDNFSLGGVNLGALELKATNAQIASSELKPEAAEAKTGGQREWRLDTLRLETPEYTTVAKGTWRYSAGFTRQSTNLELVHTMRDTGAMLGRLGMPNVLRGGEGEISGRMRWAGAPTVIDYASLDGGLALIHRKGQFLQADPGLAKLLGVLSLQSLPRRLTLDFNDVFSKGFAYDEVRADVQLNAGVATTSNLRMVGPSATVLMDGSFQLAAETQQLNILVLPDLNATAGSLVYSILIANPAMGLASLLADAVLKTTISKVFSVQYKVTGPWASPMVERVRRPEP